MRERHSVGGRTQVQCVRGAARGEARVRDPALQHQPAGEEEAGQRQGGALTELRCRLVLSRACFSALPPVSPVRVCAALVLLYFCDCLITSLSTYSCGQACWLRHPVRCMTSICM